MRWSASICSSDPVLYQAHLVHQFKRACEVIKSDFMFQAYYHRGLTNCGRRILKELLQITLDEDKTNELDYIFEEKMPLHHSCI